MIKVTLMGGLGNQMFQYACAYALAKEKNTDLEIDLSFLLDRRPRENFVFRDYDLDIFECHNQIQLSSTNRRRSTLKIRLTKIINSILPVSLRSVYYEPGFAYSSEIVKVNSQVRLEGYWQSPKYFSNCDEEIRELFELAYNLDNSQMELKKNIESTNSICLNVRRADFVNSTFHGTCDKEYYIEGLRILQERLIDCKIYVFSDDIDWCRDNLSFNLPTFFVDHSYSGQKFGAYLELMKCCKHFIIPNSTFAWWAAYLSEEVDKIVIAPKLWFLDSNINTQDLIPVSWIRI